MMIFFQKKMIFCESFFKKKIFFGEKKYAGLVLRAPGVEAGVAQHVSIWLDPLPSCTPRCPAHGAPVPRARGR
jgi:hypothetical protein